MDIEDLTLGFNYILELDPDFQIPENSTVDEIKRFLKSTSDIAIINRLVKYNVPFLYKILKFEENMPFLYIAVFAVKTPKGAHLDKALDILGPYSKILTENKNMPFLPTLLFNGIFDKGNSSAARYNSDKVVCNTEEYKRLTEFVIDNDDIFVIYGQPGTGKTTLVKCIINRLINKQPLYSGDCLQHGAFSINDYENRLRFLNRPNYETVTKVKSIVSFFLHFVFTKEAALNTLYNMRDTVLLETDRALLQELNKLIDNMAAPRYKLNRNIARLQKNIYSLPRNEIIYEDNGERIINETIIRLEKYTGFINVKNYISKLKEMMLTRDKSETWFAELSELRKELLIKLTPEKNNCLTKREKKQIIDMSDRIISFLTNKADNKHKSESKTINNFINSIKENHEILERYISPLDFTRPIVYGGCVIIDMDMCTDSNIIIDAVLNAEKIIALGSYDEGLFNIFLNAARTQTKKDEKPRVVRLQTNFRQHPEIAKFISRSFFEKYGMPKINIQNKQNNKSKPFLWIEAGSNTKDVAFHIYESLHLWETIGILAPFPDDINSIKQELGAYGLQNEIKRIEMGTEERLRNKEFDILYIVHAEAITDEKDLCKAMSKAKYVLVAIGNSRLIKSGTLLQDFYHNCIGGEFAD